MKKIIIAIDGYSSTGKSTVAKQLAKNLGYVYVDTGAMYRAVTLFAMREKLIGKNVFKKEELIRRLDEVQLSFKFNHRKGFAEVYLNEENVEAEIRSMAVSSYVSQIAAIPEVRKKQVEIQSHLGKNKGIVMDGRDIGTVVFPEAELKIFMTSSNQKRAQRRLDELLGKGFRVDFEEVLTNLKKRDEIDTTRKDSPLKQAEDAVLIDNTNMTLEEQFEKVLVLAKQVIGNRE